MYENKSCTKLASPAGTGGYEWYPLPTGSPAPKLGFTAHGEKATLESVLGSKVVCEASSATGQFTGEKAVGHVVVTFGPGCSALSIAKCNSLGEPPGTIETNDLSGELHWAHGPAAKKIVLDLVPENEPLFVEIECVLESFVTPIQVRGSLLVGIKAGKMATTVVEKYVSHKGIQKPDFYEEVAGIETHDFLESSLGAKEFAQAGQTFTNIQTNEEPLEANWFA